MTDKQFQLKRNQQTGLFEVIEFQPTVIGTFGNGRHAEAFLVAMKACPDPAATDTSQQLLREMAQEVTDPDPMLVLKPSRHGVKLEKRTPVADADSHRTAIEIWDRRYNSLTILQKSWLEKKSDTPFPPDHYAEIQWLVQNAPDDVSRTAAQRMWDGMVVRDRVATKSAKKPAPENPPAEKLPPATKGDSSADALVQEYIKKMVPLKNLISPKQITKEMLLIADLVDGKPSKEWFDRLVVRKKAVKERLDELKSEQPDAHPDQSAADFLKNAKLLSSFKTVEECKAEIEKIDRMGEGCTSDNLADKLMARRDVLADRMKKLTKNPDAEPKAMANEAVHEAKKAEGRAKAKEVDDGFVDRVADELVENVHPLTGTSLNVVLQTLALRNDWEKAEIEAALAELVKQDAITICPAPHERTARVFLDGVAVQEPMTGDEELVYDNLTKAYEASDTRFLEVPDVAKFKKLFKGSLQRDCMRHLKKLEEKNHLGIIADKEDRLVIRLAA